MLGEGAGSGGDNEGKKIEEDIWFHMNRTPWEQNTYANSEFGMLLALTDDV